MTRDFRDPVRFSHHMVDEVRETVRAGYGSEADIAEQLAAAFDDRITAADVKRWRLEHPRFNIACSAAAREANIVITRVLYEAAKGGDLATARHWADRRIPAFMPKSRADIRSNTATLDDELKQRSEEDLYKDGTLYDDDEGETGY